MRSRKKILAALFALALAGCSSAGVAPKISMRNGFHGGKPRTIYVISERDRDAVTESLQKAGFGIAQDASSAGYVLRVSIGAKRKTAPCGTVNNVRYALGGDAATVLEIQARGWTGTCSPNVYDDMSAALANAFPTSTQP